ncbi:MAG: hypothetical protein ACWA40_05625 [Planktomarina sp.]
MLFGAIRAAYSRQKRTATDADLVGLSETVFAVLEANAKVSATRLIFDLEQRANAQANIQEEISDILSGHPSAIGYHQNRACQLLIESGFEADAGTVQNLSAC